MKIIITTSDKYHHILPVFFHLYNKYWGAPFELVGYKEPEGLPDNCTFVSLGKQGDKSEFSSDMNKYFSSQPSHFIWMMEDTFLKDHIKVAPLNYCIAALAKIGEVGRISLTNDGHRNFSEFYFRGYFEIFKTPQDSFFRLSLQPAIWNREYLLKHLTPGLDPWKFETQTRELPAEKYFLNVAIEKNYCPLSANEGVRRYDLSAFNFEGIDIHTLNEMKERNII